MLFQHSFSPDITDSLLFFQDACENKGFLLLTVRPWHPSGTLREPSQKCSRSYFWGEHTALPAGGLTWKCSLHQTWDSQHQAPKPSHNTYPQGTPTRMWIAPTRKPPIKLQQGHGTSHRSQTIWGASHTSFIRPTQQQPNFSLTTSRTTTLALQ